MANQITIEGIEINNFKNIVSFKKTFDGKNGVSISGKNRLGKTNILNAISWCITGNDILGTATTSNFINNEKKTKEPNENETVMSVKLDLNSGSIERKVIFAKGKYATKLFIDDIETKTLKEGEKLIDKKLGILELTLSKYQPEKLSIRKLLINPLLLVNTSETLVRELILRQLDEIVGSDIKEFVEACPTIIKDSINEVLDQLDSAEFTTIDKILYLQDKAKSDIKDAEKVLTEKKVIKDFMDSNLLKLKPSNDIVIKVVEDYQIAVADYSNAKDNKVMIDAFLENVNTKYHEAAKKIYTDLKIELLDYSSPGDVKPWCNIYIKGKEVLLKNASTSEKIINCVKFVNQYVSYSGYDVHVPILIDEGESIDVKNAKLFETNELKGHFAVITFVNDEEEMQVASF